MENEKLYYIRRPGLISDTDIRDWLRTLESEPAIENAINNGFLFYSEAQADASMNPKSSYHIEETTVEELLDYSL